MIREVNESTMKTMSSARAMSSPYLETRESDPKKTFQSYQVALVRHQQIVARTRRSGIRFSRHFELTKITSQPDGKFV